MFADQMHQEGGAWANVYKLDENGTVALTTALFVFAGDLVAVFQLSNTLNGLFRYPPPFHTSGEALHITFDLWPCRPISRHLL